MEKIYSKTFHPSDYEYLKEEVLSQQNIWPKIHNLYLGQHEHRTWEYGLVINLVKKYRFENILDVGGYGSPLAAYLRHIATSNINISVVDKIKPNNNLYNIVDIRDDVENLDTSQYDFISCISVIEHVIDDLNFFKHLLKVKNTLLLTTDFHKSGKPLCGQHLRTYTSKDLEYFIEIGKQEGFLLYNDMYKFNDDDIYVNNYNFASLILTRKV